jgi:hypothetical protein
MLKIRALVATTDNLAAYDGQKHPSETTVRNPWNRNTRVVCRNMNPPLAAGSCGFLVCLKGA